MPGEPPGNFMHPRDRVQSLEPATGDDVGGYVLKALLGQGGFGTVYLAERGGQRYALKLLPLAGLRDWGERELLMLARVKHPNVVRLLGYWHWPDQAPCFLVVIMEYVEGRRLDVWAETENPTAHAVLLRILGVARALRALHEGKALHRDVKEANILVREADGEAVLVDLGVGTHEDTSRVTGGSLPPGTRAYLSPEAWRFHREHGKAPDAHYRSTPADDVYALGVVLYWLLTGTKPFHMVEGNDGSMVRSGPLVSARARNGRVPEELSTLCMRLLEEGPEQRPGAASLVAQVEELLTRDLPEWHAPLCDFHDAHNVTTRPGPDADEEVVWLNEVREDFRPRRGRRWPRPVEHESTTPAPEAVPAQLMEAQASASGMPDSVAEASLPASTVSGRPDSVAEEPLPASTVGLEPRDSDSHRATWRTAALGVLLAVSCAALLSAHLGGWWMHSFADEEGEPAPGWKVAPPVPPPESSGAAVPHGAVSTPAAIALPTMPSEEPAPVKTQNPAGDAQQPTSPVRGRGSAGKTLQAAAAACALLGCTGAQVRERPSPEPCPPGAAETMKQLGINVGDKMGWSFGGSGNRVLTVREGWTSVEIVGADFGDIPNGSIASGRLILGDRVYGRMTQVRFRDTGRTVPVCMELLDGGSERGLELEPGSAPTNLRVFSVGYIRAVRSFE
ncbi:protein kinase [Pyxidicoccus parkwayensis]|uniref:non-specific serine/threonine protein kinase n=1 Tax=Pyxidicoccus parkwayensis TaxID=2813578 RepID=A0ABX7NUY1_9BACT|nr:serine/threonine-protein kinase [Pyxidicoccus parkwaysis]QSQ21199.1 protein kinase [Pyxidicoccus parkwaysis]